MYDRVYTIAFEPTMGDNTVLENWTAITTAVMQAELVLLHDCIVPCAKFWMYASFRWWAEYSKGLGWRQIEIFTMWNTKYETRQSFKKLAFQFQINRMLVCKISYYKFLLPIFALTFTINIAAASVVTNGDDLPVTYLSSMNSNPGGEHIYESV